MKKHLLSFAISLTVVVGCAAGADNRASNTPQKSTCVGDAECGASQSCQKEEGKASGTCMAAAAGSNAQKSTCVGDAECGVGQLCRKD
jgi:hypothetical protein